MNDTTRTILIALGIALLFVVLLPLLFMTGMMGGMVEPMNGWRLLGHARPGVARPGRRRRPTDDRPAASITRAR